jgi:hypothetical protein
MFDSPVEAGDERELPGPVDIRAMLERRRAEQHGPAGKVGNHDLAPG